MGSAQSVQVVDEEEEEDDDDDDDEEEEQDNIRRGEPEVKKVLQQEPEMLPCYASASPLSPQLSSLGTPRLGPSIKVWDPYNVLAPPPSLPPNHFSRNYSFDASDDRGLAAVTEVYLICHGESELSLRPDVISGRSPSSGLTANGKRQARALAVFLNSQGVRFNAVYSSPLDRARATAISICQEMSFAEQQIQISDALTEMSQGLWEGCLRSEIYTYEMLGLIDGLQPDFSAPSGESLRQLEFRMAQFLNGTLLGLPEKLKSELLSPSHQNEGSGPGPGPGFPQQNDGPSSFPPSPQWDLLSRHRQLSRKKSGKSRLQVVTTTTSDSNNHYPEDEMSPQGCSQQSMNSSCCVGVFTHSVPIKCIVTGLLGCSPLMSHKLCIDDSSVTVLQHSYKTGWQVKRLNDTAHLRLL
ncbi:hypothetical protein V2J09_009079 [Rumex salicifolius]